MIVTVYTRRVKHRGDKHVSTVGCVYSTTSETPVHARIRKAHPDAETWENPTRVITDFIRGMNLGCLPLISGGRRVA